MPELPDVEVYRRRLAARGLRRRVARVRLQDPTALRGVSHDKFVLALEGRELVDASRRGKHLFAATSGTTTLVMHFGMTGLLSIDDDPERVRSYERLVLEFEDGGVLSIVDPRKLGFVTVVDDVAAYVADHDLGPDALTLEAGDVRRLARSYRGGVKSMLMDQSLIAGIGNIYSDEILFQARVDPRRRADSLDDAQVRRLHRQMLRVLRMAADRGADSSRFPEGWILRHRWDHAPCPRGNGEIQRIRHGGRGTYFCPACQH